MSEEDFERQLARRLRDYSEGGLQPFDALAIARGAMSAGGRARQERDRRGLGRPPLVRTLVLAGLLGLLLVGAAVVGGLIQLPPPLVVPTPSATVSGEQSPSFVPPPTPTGVPSPTSSPAASPTQTPASPSPSPSASPSAVPPSPSPSASPSPVPPSPTASPSQVPSPTPAIGWREVSDFPAGQSDSFAATTYGAAGFVFVAVQSGGGNSWVSADGTSWTRSADGGFDGARHVVARGSEYIAIGTAAGGQGRRVWRSTDGLNWTLLAVSPVLEFVNDLTVDNGVLIAVGTSEDFDAPRVWRSDDGVNWTAMAAPASSTELTAVVARGGDIVVLADDFTGYGRVIYSLQAQTGEWLGYLPFGEDRDGRLVDLASNGLDFVAVGYEDDFDSGIRTPTIRSSPDGTNWTETRVAGSGSDVFEQLAVLPDRRLLAIGSSRGYTGSGNRLTMHEVAYSYLSTNGTAWQPGQQIWERTERVGPEIGDQVERYRPVAAGGPGALVGDEWAGDPKVFFAPVSDLR